MGKINCNVIQDILPLYIDDTVSDDTKELVEEHLQNCEICQRVSAYPFSKSSTCLWVTMWAHFVCPFSILVTLFYSSSSARSFARVASSRSG